ncbi:MAG: type IVB secretion system protein IcmH/DotU [Endozoicomonas sp. (ex Botrylloides leachii)]|nr:type IVB secretion system protein IcmH/DotU [Endozoicomonas sp. (ex Botrylloides leachii)]
MNQTYKSIKNSKQDNYKEISDTFKNFCTAENQLLNISSEFIALLTTLPQYESNEYLPDLYQYIAKGMRALHNKGVRIDYSPRLMEKACYVICAAFDEEIMNSNVGQATFWENKTLVSGLFKQRNSGEFFFILMEQALQNSSRMIDFIELQYLLLRLGFKGKYANTQEHKLVELTNRLFDVISNHRQNRENKNEIQPVHSPWKPIRQPSPIKLLPFIVILLFISVVMSHIWIQFLHQDANKSLDEMLQMTVPVSTSQ